MSQVFNRFEKKYMLDEETYHRVREALYEYMVPDKYSTGDGCYIVNNIYLDTDDHWFIRDSLQHPRYKEKLRLRCYGEAGNHSSMFFEIKKKINRRVNKRRVKMDFGNAMEFINSHVSPDESAANRQINNEITYILDQKSPTPKVALFYDRKAFFLPQDDDLRITFDYNLRARRTEIDFDHESYGSFILPPDKYIMEVKVSTAYPLWLAETFSELKLSRVSYSKYGNEYRQFLHDNYAYGEYRPK